MMTKSPQGDQLLSLGWMQVLVPKTPISTFIERSPPARGLTNLEPWSIILLSKSVFHLVMFDVPTTLAHGAPGDREASPMEDGGSGNQQSTARGATCGEPFGYAQDRLRRTALSR